MPDEESAPYRVVPVGEVGKALKALMAQAVAHGIRDEYLSCIKSIVARLQTSPFDFGEPRSDLQWMRLQVRIGVHIFLAVRYAVDEEHRIVYLLNVIPLSGHGLS